MGAFDPTADELAIFHAVRQLHGTAVILDTDHWAVVGDVPAYGEWTGAADLRPGHFAGFLDNLGGIFPGGRGTVLLAGEAAPLLGLPAEYPEGGETVEWEAHREALGALGWSTPPTFQVLNLMHKALSATGQKVGPGRHSRMVSVIVHDWWKTGVSDSYRELWHPSPLVTAANCVEFQRVLGVPFAAHMPGHAWHTAARFTLDPKGRCQWKWTKELPDDGMPGLAVPFTPGQWFQPDAIHTGHKSVLMLDNHAAYVSAFQSALVSKAPLEWNPRATRFDPRVAALWRCEVEPWPHGDVLPRPWGYPTYEGNTETTFFLPTPVVSLLFEASRDEALPWDGFKITGAFTPKLDPRASGPAGTAAGQSVQLFRPLASVTRDALLIEGRCTPEVRGAIKASFKKSIGLLTKSNGWISRPDWHHQIIGWYAASLWRKVRKAQAEGWAPLAINTDAVYLGSRQPWVTPKARIVGPKALVIGRDLGQFEASLAPIPAELTFPAVEAAFVAAEGSPLMEEWPNHAV